MFNLLGFLVDGLGLSLNLGANAASLKQEITHPIDVFINILVYFFSVEQGDQVSLGSSADSPSDMELSRGQASTRKNEVGQGGKGLIPFVDAVF